MFRGGKFPFFEILQQYDFVVINYNYLNAEGNKQKKTLTFKDGYNQHLICQMLDLELKQTLADNIRMQTRVELRNEEEATCEAEEQARMENDLQEGLEAEKGDTK